MDDWFTLERIDEDTDILSEYRHWEETHCYLLRGRERSLLIDTGLGICDIRQAVDRLTDRPVAAVATHIHWDHIGGHRYFPEFYAHEAELNWLSGGFPLSVEAVRAMVADRCCLPEDFDVSRYTLFQGYPARVLRDGDRIELELEMKVKLWEGNPEIVDTCGRVAVTRGPLVYCAEGVDNDDTPLRDVRIDWDAAFELEKAEVAGREMPVLKVQASRREASKALYSDRKGKKVSFQLKLLPYYAWANRGVTEMDVWFLEK